MATSVNAGPNINLGGFTYEDAKSFGENLFNFYKEVLNKDNVDNQKYGSEN
tara:strand:+ start:3147 stop:3299 length:153 start_codon:yes stop_codon:yes gene_type:complete